MDINFLEIIKTRTIFLKEGEPSSEIVLEDNKGEGNMYFTIILKYVESEQLKTHLTIDDAFHAIISIETTPNSLTSLLEPEKVGTYANDKDLFINFRVQPRNADDAHSVTITFYTNKE